MPPSRRSNNTKSVKDRLDFIDITEIGEAQAMMEMIRHEHIGNPQNVSTDKMRMHMDPEIWFQQHNYDSDIHHLNNHLIDIVQKYMRGNATRMKRISSLVLLYTNSNTAREFLPGTT